MQELRYERPVTATDAVALLAQDGTRVLAGGTDLIPQLREGRRTARTVVDLKHISDMTALSRLADGSWRLGAAASIGMLGRNAGFAAAHPGLLASARLIGSLQIQNRATLGGNLSNAAPSADAVPLLIALGAQAEISALSGQRTVSVEAIAVGPGRTSLQPGEVVVTIVLPPPAPSSAAVYHRFTPRREMDIAVAGSGVHLAIGTDGTIALARIVLASVAPRPLRALKAETVLIGEKPSAALFAAAGAAAAAEARPISDTRGSADYRRELIAVLTRRALTDCSRQLRVTAR